jgi:arylsulfatase A-like enzyme
MKARLRSLAVLPLLLAAAACGEAAETSAPAGLPNIVLISSDTLRADRLGVNGYFRNLTPNLDALAESGVNFTRAYSHAPNTAPSHTSLLTSLFPSVHGVFEHGQALDPNVVTLAEALQESGYATAGFTQLNGGAYTQGFDTWERVGDADERGRGATGFDTALDWVQDHSEGPFFLFLHSYNVHLPYNPPAEYRERWAGDYQGPLPEALFRDHIDAINAGSPGLGEAEQRYATDLYDAEVEYYDRVIGEFFDGVRKLRLWDETLFVFLADHGEEFGDHGLWGRHTYSLYEELIRVPLIIVGPGVPVGLTIDEEVQLVDVAPTLLTLAGLSPPASFMGEDLRRAWGNRQRRPRVVVAEKKDERVLIQAGYKYYPDGRLYDLHADPLEQTDLSDTDPEITGRMRRTLIDWLANALRRAESIDQAEDIRLTPAEERRLRALGYLQ